MFIHNVKPTSSRWIPFWSFLQTNRPSIMHFRYIYIAPTDPSPPNSCFPLLFLQCWSCSCFPLRYLLLLPDSCRSWSLSSRPDGRFSPGTSARELRSKYLMKPYYKYFFSSQKAVINERHQVHCGPDHQDELQSRVDGEGENLPEQTEPHPGVHPEEVRQNWQS